MFKRIFLVFIVVVAFGVGFTVKNASPITPKVAVGLDTVVTAKQQTDFNTKLTQTLKQSALKTQSESKKGETPTSPFANAFQQQNALVKNPNSITFNPVITGGGLNYNGSHFTITMDNNASSNPQSFVINGDVSANGNFSHVEVDSYAK